MFYVYSIFNKAEKKPIGKKTTKELFKGAVFFLRASQVVLVVKNLQANARDTRDTGWNPGSGRSPKVGNGNPLQYSCLENILAMDRGAWQATVHRAKKGGTKLSTHTHIFFFLKTQMRLIYTHTCILLDFIAGSKATLNLPRNLKQQ